MRSVEDLNSFVRFHDSFFIFLFELFILVFIGTTNSDY